jgi:hypothetical protein
LSEEVVEFAAGGIEETLLVFRAVMNERAAALVDLIAEQPVRGSLSERRVVVQVPDDFSAQPPKIVDMSAQGNVAKTGRPSTWHPAIPRPWVNFATKIVLT